MLKTLFEDVLDFLFLLKWTIPFLFDEFRFLFLIGLFSFIFHIFKYQLALTGFDSFKL